MFFFPYATDAPLYHRPIGTVLLIILNVVITVALPGDDGALWWGDGLHPTQWLTSHFVHAGLVHLFVNMVFLWVFGLVVEGKVGFQKFLALYLGIGIVESAVEQTIMLGASGGGSIGASSIIFGLVAIAMIWAPQNEVRIFYVFWFVLVHMGSTQKTIRFVAVLYLICEASWAVLELLSGAPSSSFLHVLGAAVGLPIGIIMVKRDWVDCDGWDIFSLRYGRPKEIKLFRNRSDDPVPEGGDGDGETEEGRDEVDPLSGVDATQRRTDALDLIEDYVKEGDIGTPVAIYDDVCEETGEWSLPSRVVLDWAAAAEERGELGTMHRVLRRGVMDHPTLAIKLRLLLARAYLDLERPISALEVLEDLGLTVLFDFQKEERERLLAEVEAQRAAGVLEFDLDE